MKEFGELALVIGDLHIPQRAVDIPDEFKKLLVPNKMQYILSTGNIGSRETLDWLRGLTSNVHIVHGEFDETGAFPDTKVVEIGDWKIGLIHGHQVIPWGDEEALANIQRQLNCDILISGHTHVNSISTFNGKYFINPGSATGAYTSLSSEVVPSFVLMAFQGNEVTVFVYEWSEKSDTVEVSKSHFKKA
eukprot:CAMPEP_0114978308 /NCGR_PEP_ID=MMETSP0216-20121206/3734_1 /TAXON_ID=223996 /ORGANISM="Protocruzia adherens, Strain Boccale" /LENGTH=189 /DNA_ID=CAMNT_0002339489 /DNA_START=42 /DNA_END=611 /DNA_ORIENTATION=+